ncbi:MAG: GGDEF domain-containing protein [Rhodopila sp.]|nr:GGDEF domain-containing protein [Rhodopila sp.]
MPFGGDYDGSIVAVLEQLRLTADLEGLAILDLSQDAADAPVAYCVGDAGQDTTAVGQAMLTTSPGQPSHTVARDKRRILACPWVLPPARPGGLLLWRAPRSKAWTEADHGLAASVALLLRITIGAGMGQVGIDRLTGLPNRRWFLDEADRHIDRLEPDGTVGTLLLVDIDDLRRINLTLGRGQGDRVLVRLASQIRAKVRPGDLVARVGEDEIAVWLTGMDHLTAAERADSFCNRPLFQGLPDGHGVTLSIGIASRYPGSTEDIRTLLRRAHMAARDVKTKGGGGWRVSHPETAPRCFGPRE